MKLTILALLLTASAAMAAGTVSLTLAWDYQNLDAGFQFKLYSLPTPTGAATMVTNVVGLTNCTVIVNRPSDQYFYVTAARTDSNPTNYTGESDPSNIIRVRVLGNGTLKVAQ